MDETTPQIENNNTYHNHHHIDLGFSNFVKKITPPVLFSLTLWGIIYSNRPEPNLYYPLAIFSGMTLFNNFM